MKYDVFISFKNSGRSGKPTPDALVARKVHEALKSAGIGAFFSEESLAEKGTGQFSKAIESALDSAKVLILVASCREHIESRWVEAEWDSFLQDVRSGHKEGELFILNCGDLKPAELPLFLRRQQMFRESDLEKMLSFVSNAMAPQANLNDLIELCLHCFRPDKNEDKVYLVTVQEGTSSATRNVVAHWGARSAKRLSSQVKAINVSADAARAEIEKARQEKIRGGYAPASHVGLLSAEAWTFLSASLGVADAPPRQSPSFSNNSRKPSKVRAKTEKPTVPADAKGSKSQIANSGTKATKTTGALKSTESAKRANAAKDNKAIKAATPTKVLLVRDAVKPPAAPAAGRVCISGKLPSGRKKADYAQPLKEVGLQLVDDVVKDLTYLVVADPDVSTGKSDKARRLGIAVLSEKQLEALITRRSKALRRK